MSSAPGGVDLSWNGGYSTMLRARRGQDRGLLGRGKVSSDSSSSLAAHLCYGSGQYLPLHKNLFPYLDKGMICPDQRIKHLVRGKNFDILQPVERWTSVSQAPCLVLSV